MYDHLTEDKEKKNSSVVQSNEGAARDLLCKCSSNRSPTYIDPFGYHFVGCKVDAHAIRLLDNVVHQLMTNLC